MLRGGRYFTEEHADVGLVKATRLVSGRGKIRTWCAAAKPNILASHGLRGSCCVLIAMLTLSSSPPWRGAPGTFAALPPDAKAIYLLARF